NQGRGGDDLICGNGGNDTIYGGHGDDRMSGGLGEDSFLSLDGAKLEGGGSDVERGGPGRDWFYADPGGAADRYDGGHGFDSISFAAATGPVRVDLTMRTATGQGADTVISVGYAKGSAFGDTLIGNARANWLV